MSSCNRGSRCWDTDGDGECPLCRPISRAANRAAAEDALRRLEVQERNEKALAKLAPVGDYCEECGRTIEWDGHTEAEHLRAERDEYQRLWHRDAELLARVRHEAACYRAELEALGVDPDRLVNEDGSTTLSDIH